MKRVVLVAGICVLLTACARHDVTIVDLQRADEVVVWDQRISDATSVPVKVTDPGRIRVIASLILESPGEWRDGKYTSPTGDIGFTFLRAMKPIASFRVGSGFVLRGGNADWQTKTISHAIERQLREIAQPNQSVLPPSTSVTPLCSGSSGFHGT